jgi:transaldolase
LPTTEIQPTGKLLISQMLDYLLVLFGLEILKIIPGRVSTETDASLSFDTDGLVNKAHHFISLYKQNGIAKERILIKIATTWEGIRARRFCKRRHQHKHDVVLAAPSRRLPEASSIDLIFRGAVLDW